nr:Chain C, RETINOBLASTOMA-BINDING PROTEIN 5 [Mus musculus]2XL2_D Chain D, RETINOBLASTOMA-BINDING PROTEIN 5 [Mus musculus]2XL3_C Chain C, RETINOBLASTOMA-BINDING PROTEIN 5 [Mus musculus]2XL3_E Chain E, RETINOBLASTOMA-BINDING PROTEIN 5 [Mus musculus]
YAAEDEEVDVTSVD